MRLMIAGVVLLFTTPAAAQSRWTLSTGPEWRQEAFGRFWGLRARAEYDLTKPSQVFGIRFESGLRWGPSQRYSYPNSRTVDTVSLHYGGTEQRLDVMFGFNAALAALPRAAVSPYITAGVFGRQTWTNGSFYSIGETSSTRIQVDETKGDILATLGLGLRVRLGNRAFQMEFRAVTPDYGLTLGTRLPF